MRGALNIPSFISAVAAGPQPCRHALSCSAGQGQDTGPGSRALLLASFLALSLLDFSSQTERCEQAIGFPRCWAGKTETGLEGGELKGLNLLPDGPCIFFSCIPVKQLVTLPITNRGAAGRGEDVFSWTSHGQINPPRSEKPGVN